MDPTPVPRSTAVVDGHVPRRRPQATTDYRVDPTRVTGPVRLVLEPMLWVAFVSGVIWLLVAVDPGLRDPDRGVELYRYTLPLAVLVGVLLVVSTVTALMWLPTSTTAARARTSFAGLGMLASGWLFAAVDPVDSTDFVAMSWLCIGIGVLLVAVCAVPWPTAASHQPGPPGRLARGVVLALTTGIAIVAVLAWQAAQDGLLGRAPGTPTAWDDLLPLLAVLAVLIAGVRHVLRMPARPHAG